MFKTYSGRLVNSKLPLSPLIWCQVPLFIKTTPVNLGAKAVVWSPKLPSIRWRNIKHTTQLNQRRAIVVHCQMIKMTNIAHRHSFRCATMDIPGAENLVPVWSTIRRFRTMVVDMKLMKNANTFGFPLRYRSAFAFINISRSALCLQSVQLPTWEGINFTWKPLYWYPKNSGWRLLSSERQDLHKMAKGENSIRPGNDTITAGHVHAYHT